MIARRATLAIMLIGVGTMTLQTFGDHSPLLVWNASASVPIGLYAIQPVDQLGINELVVVRPPDNLASLLANGGYLPRGVPLVKRVAALPGQTVCRVGGAVTIDTIAAGEARERDSRGRPLPVWQGCRVLADGEVFLMNPQSADSFDGRYFGPLPAASIVGRATPLWTDPPERKE